MSCPSRRLERQIANDERLLNSWLEPIVIQFVSAQNVSLAHLLYEARLIEGRDVGGNAYVVTDPGAPTRYADLYHVLGLMCHPSTPVVFTHVPAVLMLIACEIIQAYILLQHRYLNFLPKVTVRDLQMLQPAVHNYSLLHPIYDYARAKKEIGYDPQHGTLEGVCLHVIEWNEKVEKKLQQEGKVPSEATTLEKNIPFPVSK
jgi:hypothetical protein